MFCHKCGNRIPDGGQFCPNCGEKIEHNAVAPKKTSKAKIAIIIIAVVLVVAIVVIAGFFKLVKMYDKAVSQPVEGISETIEENIDEDNIEEEDDVEKPDKEDVEEDADADYDEGDIEPLTRQSLLPLTNDESEIAKIKPSVPEIKIDDDFGNIINKEELEWRDKDFLDKLKKNGFVVSDGAGREFFEPYEMNRYLQIPNFVTVDSMMHTYHIYFAYLMRDIEKNHLYDDLSKLTEDMMEESFTQYEALRGSEWEDAAKRNMALFSVAALLLDTPTTYPSEIKDLVETEYDRVMAAKGIEESALTGDSEDYTQYKPRGYYEGDKTLEKYFRAMMWYGRRQLSHDKEDMDRSALLITLALNDGHYDQWSSIYTTTSFFAGASDDLGYCEYMPVIEKVYGKNVSVSDLAGDSKSWDRFYMLTGKLRAPRINSIPIMDSDGEDNVIPGYRFMGQRFTVDASIMQDLVYRRVGEYDDEDKRMLPDFLDVPAALGSKKAYSLLDDMGATKYKNYDRNLKNLIKEFNNDDNTIWNASLYAGWLNTLRPLLTEKQKGYPTFMQNDEWTKKDLETFAGSYTELKHDTVLYSKQIMAEMGGGWDEDKDYRGYVEPEPLVYLRFENLAKNTSEGLKKLGYLSKADEDNLAKLADLADKLKVISVKELQNENLDKDEYELIEIYGGEIEHFWLDAMKAQTGEEYPTSDEFPAALVVDIATDPNGSVLEMATGDPASIYVVVPVEGKLRIAHGCVYSFYQFVNPISGRLTDTEWRRMMGIEVDENDNYVNESDKVKHPDWANSYRFFWNTSNE